MTYKYSNLERLTEKALRNVGATNFYFIMLTFALDDLDG